MPAPRRGLESHLRNDTSGRRLDAGLRRTPVRVTTHRSLRPSCENLGVDDEQNRIAGIYRTYDSAISGKWSRRNPGNRFLEAVYDTAFDALLAQEGLTPLTGKRILDIGCGTGEFLRALCEKGAVASDCHGLDILPNRIERAREASSGIEFHHGDARTTRFDAGSFDLVFANMVFV